MAPTSGYQSTSALVPARIERPVQEERGAGGGGSRLSLPTMVVLVVVLLVVLVEPEGLL